MEEDAKRVPALRGYLEKTKIEDFTVFHCNWKALQVFQLCTSQWRLAPSGEIQSMDYQAVAAVIDMLNVPRKKRGDLFRRITLIESGALEALRKKRMSKR